MECVHSISRLHSRVDTGVKNFWFVATILHSWVNGKFSWNLGRKWSSQNGETLWWSLPREISLWGAIVIYQGPDEISCCSAAGRSLVTWSGFIPVLHVIFNWIARDWRRCWCISGHLTHFNYPVNSQLGYLLQEYLIIVDFQPRLQIQWSVPVSYHGADTRTLASILIYPPGDCQCGWLFNSPADTKK